MTRSQEAPMQTSQRQTVPDPLCNADWATSKAQIEALQAALRTTLAALRRITAVKPVGAGHNRSVMIQMQIIAKAAIAKAGAAS